MSFLKSLFGGRKSDGAATSGSAAPTKTAVHKGFTIEARPFKESW